MTNWMSASGLRPRARVVGAALCSPRVVADLKSAWTAAGLSVDAARNVASVPLITPARCVAARLRPESEVALQAPGRRPAGHAGILDFTVPSAGIYRVMSSERAWIEVLSPDGLPQPAYVRPLRCLRGEGVHKEPIHRLEAGLRYTLEVSAVAGPALDLPIIAEPTR